MEKKLYVLKNGDNPGIYLDWLSFFEKIDGMSMVKYKIFTYSTEYEDEDVTVPHSREWAFRMAREYLGEAETDDSEKKQKFFLLEEADDLAEDEEFPFDEVFEPDKDASGDCRSVVEEVKEEKPEENGWDAELRVKLGIREELHKGTPWLDMLLEVAGLSSGFNVSYSGRYHATTLYTLLLYLVLEPKTVLEALYIGREALADGKSGIISKESWVSELLQEWFRGQEYVQLKNRFEANGLSKLDLEDVRQRNIEMVKGGKLLKTRPSYFSMYNFLKNGKHTLIDLYEELVGNSSYREELKQISGAVINPDLVRKKLDKKEKLNTLEQLVAQTKSVRETLKEIIVGQDDAIDKLEQAFFHDEKTANIRKKSGPRSVFLFAGPPGVGKTFMAENFARKLGMDFRRFDMSGYGSRNAMEEVVGISSFYMNAKPGVLTSYVEEHPGSVLLFDEIEKASKDVIMIFLQILDEGKCFDRFYDDNVSFKDCIIIMTTNAGKQLYENAGSENLSEMSEQVIIDGLVKDIDPDTKVPYFPPEIVSRMASHTIIMFNHLKAAAIRQVIKSDVEKNLSQNREEYGFDISKGSEIVAATVQFAAGGKGDARNASKLAGKLIDRELYELFSLIQEKTSEKESGKLKQVSWECDFTGSSEEIKQFYLGERDCVVPILKETDKEYVIPASPSLKVVILNDAMRFMDMIRRENVLFAVIDYAYGLSSEEASMSISDAKTEGSKAFDTLKKENDEIPVYLLKNDRNYLYSDSEKRVLLKKGAEGFIDEEGLVKQLIQAYSDVCCHNAMEKLAVRHQVLTFATRKEINADRTVAKIIFYNLKLETAVDSEDKESLISDDLRPNKKWSDIFVSSDVRKELEFFIQYLKKPGEYIKTGVRVPRGALMFGPPGTGKTSLAKVVASESLVNFLSVSADELLNGGAKKVHDIFRTARKYAPAVLFIDEIDAIGMSRNEGGVNSVLNALLTEMDGFKRVDSKPVFVMAATNLKGIDAALLRRFDRTFEVGLPREDGRRWLLKRLLSVHANMFCVSEKEVESIVARSGGLSPADLENIVEAALREGIRSGKAVNDTLFDEIFEKSNYGEEREVTSEKEVEHTACHEAGHAVVELYYGRAPEYMSVIARSNFNGYVQSERLGGHPTKERLLQSICTKMGGRGAELEFGYGLTPGAAADLANATKIAIRMVCEFGMYEEEMGLAVLSEEEYRSDEKAKAIVNQILKTQLELARSIIREKKDAVSRLMTAVLENEQKYLTKKDILEAYKGLQ